MANKNQIKMKKVAFVNKLLPGEPTQYKLAMMTPVVVSRDKFIQNVSDHTGLNKHIVRSVIDSIEECAGDYMEIGNAVQIGDDFGTLKPTVKVKAVDSLDKCTADTVLSISTKFIPTGNMRTRLASVGFVVKGTSDGSDVEDSEVDTTPGGDNNGGGAGGNGQQNTGGGGSTNNGGGSQNTGGGGTQNQPTNVEKYTITYSHEGSTYTTQEYEVGATVTPPTPPTGYIWLNVPSTMPARNVTCNSYEDNDPNDI